MPDVKLLRASIREFLLIHPPGVTIRIVSYGRGTKTYIGKKMMYTLLGHLNIFCIFKVHQTSITMTKVIITANVEDSAKWEAGFRTHLDLFKRMSISKPIQLSTNGNNEVALCAEPDDLEKYLEILNSQATADAMAYDGVKRETVKVFVLDKELKL